MPCTYAITVDLDVTALRAVLKTTGTKAYVAQVRALATVVNRHEEFRMTLVDGAPAIWPMLHPAYTVFNPDRETFACVSTPYDADFDAFHARMSEDLADHRHATGFFPQADLPANYFDVSSLPWTSFSSFALNIKDSWDHLAPIFTLGRYEERGEETHSASRSDPSRSRRRLPHRPCHQRPSRPAREPHLAHLTWPRPRQVSVPLNSGLRFSRKAFGPIWASLEAGSALAPPGQAPSVTGWTSSATRPCASRCTRLVASASGASTKQKILPPASSTQ